MLDGTKKRAARRGVPIHAYVGANGGGKTLCMIHDTLPSMELGRAVVSNVPLLDPRTGDTYRGWVPLKSWVQLLDVEHADVLLDEAQGVVNSRESQAMPVQMQTMLCQLRKRDVCLRLTAPNFARIDKLVREVCQAVTVCRGYAPAPDRALTKEAKTCEACAEARNAAAVEPGDVLDEDDGQETPDEPDAFGDGVETVACVKHTNRLWAMKRLFWWRTYDAMEWEQFSLQQVEAVKPLATAWYWRPGKPAEKAYDTLGSVETMDHLSEAGLCAICGGKRQHRRCGCVEHLEESAPSRRAEARQRRAPEAAVLRLPSLSSSS